VDILVVAGYPSADDPVASRFVADQVQALARAGVRPWVATFDRLHLAGDARLRDRQETVIRSQRAAAMSRATPSGWPFRSIDGIPVARIATANGPDRAGDRTSTGHRRSEALADLLALDERPPWSLVHAHMGYPEGFAAAAAATQLGIPLVITEHASFVSTFLADPGRGGAYRTALATAARVVPVSEMLRAELADALPDVAPRLRVIPNAIAVGDFRLVPPGDRDAGELLYVGYRKATKGIATLLAAMAIVHRQRDDIRLRMIGSAPTDAEERGWQARVAELGLTSVVTLEPSTDRAGVAAAMERAALLVQPSPRETFGIVAAEALASGLPVVAVDSGGVTEILSPEEDRLGAIVTNDEQALAAAILAVLDRRASLDPGFMRRHVESRYASGAVAARLLELYDDVLAGAASPAAVDPGARPHPVGPASPDRRTIVVASQRAHLDRMLAAIPPSSIAGMPIVTTGAPGPGLLIAGVDPRRVEALARWGTPPKGGAARRPAWRRLAARVARPVLGAWRRVRLESEVLDALRAAVGEAVRAPDGAAAEALPPRVVCLGGLDALVAEPLVAAGAVEPAPGGLRWLADAPLEDASRDA
jgi:glycosyltransferase involved in cell wall biosynthesis